MRHRHVLNSTSQPRNLQPYIQLALPCGAGSRAREKPLPKYLIDQGAKTPQPLRDARHVLGLPGLRPRDQARVASSNILASLVIDIIQYSMETGCFVSIENPLNSWMWLVIEHYVHMRQNDSLKRFFQQMMSVAFNHCAHGGLRPKKTKFLCTHHYVQSRKQSVQVNQVIMFTFLMRFVLMAIAAILTLRLKVNILNFFARELHSVSKTHL